MKDQILGLVRHILTFAGGILVTKGIVSEGVSIEVIGGIMTIVGSIWSVVSKKA
jgi:hypothetical protein